MLWRRRDAQAQASGQAEGRQEAHAPVRQGRHPAGGFHRRAEGGCVRLCFLSSAVAGFAMQRTLRAGRKKMKTAFRVAAVALLALATTVAPTFADDYPNKPIKVISDSAPGSAIDVMFRMVMDRLGTQLGQQIVPIDRPGAGGAIAAHAASESIPDGYTLFAPALSLFISLPGKAENLPLILPRDFLPVGSLAELPMFICASVQSGIKTLPDLIARAKARPGEISFAATGIGRLTHLTGLLLGSRAGVKLAAVPYAGGPAAALTD